MIEEATMVRNAGGRAFDAIRSLSVLQTIGDPGTIVVMHHTGQSHHHKVSSTLLGGDFALFSMLTKILQIVA
jgi:hypothetical protein